MADLSGLHRSRYLMQDDRSRQREVLHFLRSHAGVSYRVCQLAQELGLDYGQVRAAVDLLTYADTRLCEDDDGALMYLPRLIRARDSSHSDG